VDFNAAWKALCFTPLISAHSEILLPSHRKHQFDVVSPSPTRKTIQTSNVFKANLPRTCAWEDGSNECCEEKQPASAVLFVTCG